MRKFTSLSTLSLLGVTLAMASSPRRAPIRTGTYDLRDLQNVTNQTVIQFGLEDVQASVQAELAVHNNQINDMVGNLVQAAPSRIVADASGILLEGEMREVDEYGRVATQKTGAPPQIGIPMRRFQFGVGFTGDFLARATPAQIAVSTYNAEAADRRKTIQLIRNTLFNPTNSTFYDFLRDNMELPVKALYNNDGTAPPLGPNGETWDGTHSHYMGFSAFTAANLNALILNVAEHTNNARIEVYINVAQEEAVRGFSGFTPAVDPNVIVSVNQTVTVQRLDTGRQNNRMIGLFNGAEIWVKSWIFPNYAAAVDTNAAVKPIARREPTGEDAVVGAPGLRMVGTIVTFPLQSEYWGREVGYGVRNRGAAAVAQFNGTPGTYADPTNGGTA
ncbi:hypothetical protein [Deinococcus hopiensis]|uniref:Uncharacterized protein n=1 Tax=Deinococcus hopiensis KR-140 TaxID=695939 RepID=A0A1W1VJ14_9DEIO|nr:hypothetical protein [Deinococcus hopiensis]SMB93318.1 hypothetical protein SAMN00790413_01934 [Deinococcus hopiensis KR-140]